MTSKTITCYRFVTNDLTSDHDKETQWKIGEWKRTKGTIVPCESGFHACRTPRESLNNVYGSRWFIAQARGKIVNKEDKFAASEMRLIKEIPIEVIKRFELFCAKDCLKYYGKQYHNDNRVSNCIRITELYLDGKATLEELNKARAAASDAAWAASDAARAAASDAAWAASDAARAAASDAAWAASDAARAAASDAAWAAARAAAWAASDAARAAAWAASDAAKKRQNKELLRLIKKYTNGEVKQ